MITLRVVRASAATRYFFREGDSRSYGSYLDEEASHGFFWGAGAERDGLHGKPVTESAFEACAHGYSPDGREQRVVLRAFKDREPRGGFDQTLTPWKKFTILAVALPERHRADVFAGGDKAACEAIDYGDTLIYSRRGKAGLGVRDPVEVTTAVLRHSLSRPVAGKAPDPNIHWHCVKLAPAFRASDKTYGTFEVRPLFEAQWAVSRLFDVALAGELRKLGYALEIDEVGQVGIVGIPRAAVEHFSKRAQLIRAFQERNPDASIDEVRAFVVHSRLEKSKLTFTELLPRWQEEAKALGIDSASLRGKPKEIPAVAASIVQEEANLLGRSQSSFTEPDLIRRVAERYLLTGADPKQLIASVQSHLDESQTIVCLGRGKRNFARFASCETLKAEEEVMASANAVAERMSPVPKKKLDSVLSRFSHLTSGQRELVEGFAKGDGLLLCEGWAGTGKTTALAAVRELAESAGYKVMGVAPSGRAARELKEAGVNSETIASRAYRTEVSDVQMAKHHARQLLRAARNRKTFRFKAGEMLTSRHLLIVDEASMVSTQDAALIFRQAARAGARLIVVGDDNQLPHPTGAGGAFGVLKRRFGAVQLTEIVRQRKLWMREVVEALYHNAPEAALSIAAAEGKLRVCASDEVARRVLISRWHQGRTDDLSETLIIAATNDEVRELNRAAQAKRIESRELRGRSARHKGERFYGGDRVVFNANVRSLGIDGVVNGDFGEVVKVVAGDLGNPKLLIKLDRKFQGADGQRDIYVRLTADQLSLKSFGKKRSLIPHAYAVTAYKAQGATVDRAFTLHGTTVSREEAIVQLTRSREDLEIFTTAAAAGEDLDRLAASVSRTRSQTMAIEQRECQET